MDYTKLLDYAQKITIAGLLILILAGSYMGVWTWQSSVEDVKNQLKEVKSERDSWMRVALNGKSLAELAVAKAEGLPGPMRMSSPSHEAPTPESVRQDQEELKLRLESQESVP